MFSFFRRYGSVSENDLQVAANNKYLCSRPNLQEIHSQLLQACGTIDP